MKKKKLLERIVVNPEVMVGKPVIKGTRLTVQYILGLLAQGVTPDEICPENSSFGQAQTYLRRHAARETALGTVTFDRYDR